MTTQGKRSVLLTLAVLILAALACGPSIDLPRISAPEGIEQTAQAAAAKAANVAQTAVAMATRQGSAAVATVRAVGTPDLGGLQQKIEAIEPDAEGNFSVTITDDEVNEAIRLRQLVGETEIPAQFQQVTIQFTGGEVILRSNLLQPLPAQLEAAFAPRVEDGQVRFDIIRATLAGAQVPQAILNTTEGIVSRLLVEGLANLPADVTIETVSVGEGTLIVGGHRGIGP
jgi:hypothetical protein